MPRLRLFEPQDAAALRARFAALAGFVLALAACAPEDSSPLGPGRTSVLWLMLCTLRADHLGAYGYAAQVSPVLDGLAARGVLLERVVAPAPWTRPSVAAMATGLYPRTLEIDEPAPVLNDRVLGAEFETAAERFRAAGYATLGVVANPNVNAAFQFDQGYDVHRDTGVLWREGYAGEKLSAERVVGDFLGQLRAIAPDAPFFAHLVFVDIHPPYRSEVARRRSGSSRPDTDTPLYDEQVRYVDAVIGDLLGALAAAGREDVLVVVNSDHGEGLGDGPPGDVSHGTELYNSTLWVPWILYHPALEGLASRVEARVELVDMLPSVLELVGISFDPGEFEGRSLAPVVLGRGRPTARRFSVSETLYRAADKSALLDDEWKLVVDRSREERVELYRYAEDPREADDRARHEPSVVSRLRAELANWQREHPGRAERARRTQLAPAEAEALEALGYRTGE